MSSAVMSTMSCSKKPVGSTVLVGICFADEGTLSVAADEATAPSGPDATFATLAPCWGSLLAPDLNESASIGFCPDGESATVCLLDALPLISAVSGCAEPARFASCLRGDALFCLASFATWDVVLLLCLRDLPFADSD